MGDPWPWLWLAVAVACALGELLVAGTFMLLPVAAGAALALVLALVGAPEAVQVVAFVGGSAAALAALRPLARRLDIDTPANGVGAKRWMGEDAVVLEEIPAGTTETGLVRVGREQWRAESRDGQGVAVGSVVRVIDVKGTRLVVWPRALEVDINQEGAH